MADWMEQMRRAGRPNANRKFENRCGKLNPLRGDTNLADFQGGSGIVL